MIVYDSYKADILKSERNIDFDEVCNIISEKKYIEILENPSRPDQMIFLIEYHDYIHVVPFIIDEEDNIILKTVFPSRKFNKIYKG